MTHTQVRVGLLAGLLIAGVIYFRSSGIAVAVDEVNQAIEAIADRGLGEPPFARSGSPAETRHADPRAIAGWIDTVNEYLASTKAVGGWLFTVNDLRLITVDGLGPVSSPAIAVPAVTDELVGSVWITRQGIPREVVWMGAPAPNWLLLLALTGALLAALIVLHFAISIPLSETAQGWYASFRGRSIAKDQSEAAARREGALPEISAENLAVIERYAGSSNDSFLEALTLFRSHGVASLSLTAARWLAIAFQARLRGDAATAVAKSEDRLEIRLDASELCIHGLKVPMTSVPLLYYSIYAKKRRDGNGDGWIPNPPGKPSPMPKELADDFRTHYDQMKIHGRASEPWLDSQYDGRVFARQRSDITKALDRVAGVDRQLMEPYQFESESARGGREQFRIRLAPDLIVIR